MQNFSLIQLAAEGILMLHYNPSVIFFAKMPPWRVFGYRLIIWCHLYDCRGGYYPPDFYKIKSIFYFSRSSWVSEANRTFGWRSGNIANSSESENCQGNFQDLQKDLVVLRVLMLHLIKSQIERDPSVVGEPLPRLFSPDTVEKRFDAAAVVTVSPYRTNISPLCSGWPAQISYGSIF